jgi:hypothetical protein
MAFPATPEARCGFHSLADGLGALPESLQPGATNAPAETLDEESTTGHGKPTKVMGAIVWAGKFRRRLVELHDPARLGTAGHELGRLVGADTTAKRPVRGSTP